MKIVSTLSRLGRQVRSRFLDGGLILLYHRVVDSPWDPFGLSVKPDRFAEQMAFLQREVTLLSLSDFTKRLLDAKSLSRCVAVTFDDGYADNLYQALPILEQYEVPATIFIATGSLSKDFWWDRFAELLLTAEVPPQIVTLQLPKGLFRLQIGAIHSLARMNFFRSLHRELRSLTSADRTAIIHQILQIPGMEKHTPRDADSRPLTQDELYRLAAHDLVKIGAHTIDHPSLSDLSSDEQKKQIVASKAFLEKAINKPVDSFSYPFGTVADYDTHSIRHLSEAGYQCACTNILDVVWSRSKRYELPRFWVSDWAREDFHKNLSRWMHWEKQ